MHLRSSPSLCKVKLKHERNLPIRLSFKLPFECTRHFSQKRSCLHPSIYSLRGSNHQLGMVRSDPYPNLKPPSCTCQKAWSPFLTRTLALHSIPDLLSQFITNIRHTATISSILSFQKGRLVDSPAVEIEFRSIISIAAVCAPQRFLPLRYRIPCNGSLQLRIVEHLNGQSIE